MLATTKNKTAHDGFYLFILVAIIMGLVGWWLMEIENTSETVVSSRDAGEAISATYAESSFGAYVTRIETTSAIFQVQGTVAINKGERFILEVRKNGDKKLCKMSAKDCRTLTD